MTKQGIRIEALRLAVSLLEGRTLTQDVTHASFARLVVSLARSLENYITESSRGGNT